MRYVLRQKAFCLGSDYSICDEEGHSCFYVDGKALSFGNKLSFQDMEGNELAYISQKVMSWGPTYEIHRDGELAAVVKKHLFTFLKCKFSVDVPGPDDLEAVGNFMDKEYTFSRGGDEVARVSKRWFSLRDTYGVEVADGEDDVLILASLAVIDLCCHQDKK